MDSSSIEINKDSTQSTTQRINDLTSQSQTTIEIILFETSQFQETTNNEDINSTRNLITTTPTNNGSKFHLEFIDNLVNLKL